ncbi:MAG: hypothetical protein AAFW95_13150 [Cyanobacteria bacterium J06638_6]
MARSDFNMVPINHIFTANAPVMTREFPIEGSQTPRDDAYILLQVQGVAANHTVRINNQMLPGVALSYAPGNTQAWRLGFAHIAPGILRSGSNTIRIDRNPNAGDDFHVAWVVVNWRE